jgi:TPR repeat protein
LTIPRHGWGIPKDETRAVTYLSYAASNSAEIETLALQAGMKKGGAAKGELTLAIFELANCFRHAWGVKKDPVAAKQYYETAANMGDTDAMNEVAWCYLEGFGCKKDRVSFVFFFDFTPTVTVRNQTSLRVSVTVTPTRPIHSVRIAGTQSE